MRNYELSYESYVPPLQESVCYGNGFMSPCRENLLLQAAKRLGVRPDTLEEYFRTGIRLEGGGA